MKNVVQDLTSAGIDWQREKWQSGLGSKFIHQGEKNAAKYADEVIVLSKGVQDYFKETYGRKTHFICRKFIYGDKASSETYIKYLRNIGMKIGEESTIYVPTKTQIDTTRPWLIDIGKNVKITEGVTILTHVLPIRTH